jgi:hypothetical protein
MSDQDNDWLRKLAGVGDVYSRLRPSDYGLIDAIKKQTDLLSSTAFGSIQDTIKSSRLGLVADLQKQLSLSAFGSIQDTMKSSRLGLVADFQKQLSLTAFGSIQDIMKSSRLGLAADIQKRMGLLGSSYAHDLNIYPNLMSSLGRVSFDHKFIEEIQKLSVSASESFEGQSHDAIHNLAESLPEFVEIDGSQSLPDYLQNIPEKARWIFLWILNRIVLAYFVLLIADVSVGVVSDKVKPLVNQYLFGNPSATNKEISNLSQRMPDVYFEYIRFVKVNNLHVRQTANSKGKVVDKLPRGEVVTLITKNKNLNWSQIRYQNHDGEVMQGWVFSRYLQRFNTRLLNCINN